MFVHEGGRKGPWFVSVGDREDHVLVAAVVVVVDLVLVVLEIMRTLESANKEESCDFAVGK